MVQEPPHIEADETSFIDPSVIVQGTLRIGKWSRIGPGCIITGTLTIGDHTQINCGCVFRGANQIGSYVQIYDQVCIEGGRGPGVGTAQERDQSIIEDGAWINHGASMHGCQIGKHAVVGINAALDYNCRIGEGAIVMNGSACRINTVVPPHCVAEGVPAQIVQRDITDADRLRLLGLNPRTRVYERGAAQERQLRRLKGL